MKEDLHNLRRELEDATSVTEETDIVTAEAGMSAFRGRNSNDFSNQPPTLSPHAD
jgi:hypothetical protein